MADRNFYSFKLWQKACTSGAKLLWRVKSNLGLPVEQELDDGSYLSTVYDSEDDRARRHGRRVRVIEYTLTNSATPVQDSYRLVTNILDPQAAPALELAALYHERWEIEGVFDEIKTTCARPARCCEARRRPWSSRSYGDCCWRTSRCANSWSGQPGSSGSIRTD